MIASLMNQAASRKGVNEAGFELGGSVFCPRREDVAVIFGARCGDLHIQNVPGHVTKCDFLDRYWPHRTKVSYLLSKTMILDLLHELIAADDGEPHVVEDVSRLVHMLLLSILFLPNNNSSVGWKLIRYLDDFDCICMYLWCGYLIEGILEPMRKAAMLKIPGCSVFLLVSLLKLLNNNYWCFLFYELC